MMTSKNMTDIPVVNTTLLNGRVALMQPEVGFHASIDTVLLAAAVPLKDKMQLLDVGCGVGSAGLCVLARTRNAHLTGIDTQGELVAIARRNAALNDVEALTRFVEGSILAETTLPEGAFGVVMMNPPYQDGGTVSPEKIKAMSHEEAGSGATLLDWIKYGHRKLISGGSLVLIHRADRMDEIISTLVARRWFGSLTVQPLLSRVGDDAKRVIILARKERFRGMILKPGLVIHEADGSYTAAADAILRDAKPLFPLD